MGIYGPMSILADHIKSKAITQSQFAGEIGVDQATVSKLCRGVVMPGLELAVRIERVTGGAVPVASWVQQDDAA